MTHSHGNKSVTFALIGNIFVTLIKTIVAFLTGSASLFAESVHSLADTLNQSLLMIGIIRSKKPADAERGYGYGIERFFWSLISACGILFIGAGISIYHSILSLIEPSHESGFSGISIIILIVALIIEGYTLNIAVKELKMHDAGSKKFSFKMLDDADPVTLAVVYEDGAAVLGVLVAILAQILVYFTNNSIFDALGGIIVGLILGFLAIILIIKNYQFLIGKSIKEETKEEIIELLLADDCIEKIIEFKSVAVDIGKYRIYTSVEWNGTPLYEEIYGAGDLKEEYDEIKDDFKKFTKLMLKTTDRVPRLIGARIDQIEKNIVQHFPEVLYVDIEIN